MGVTSMKAECRFKCSYIGNIVLFAGKLKATSLPKILTISIYKGTDAASVSTIGN